MFKAATTCISMTEVASKKSSAYCRNPGNSEFCIGKRLNIPEAAAGNTHTAIVLIVRGEAHKSHTSRSCIIKPSRLFIHSPRAKSTAPISLLPKMIPSTVHDFQGTLLSWFTGVCLWHSTSFCWFSKSGYRVITNGFGKVLLRYPHSVLSGASAR